MLGGSFWIALLRNAISSSLMLAFFLMLDRPRFSMKKTIWCYAAFDISLITIYSVWYLNANASFVKYAALSTLFVIGIFCTLMSGEVYYLSLYKMALAFYFFSVCTFCGVDVARWAFDGNLWVDILVRFICTVIVLAFTWKKFRKQFLGGIDFLIDEMDLFSAVTLFVSVMLGAIMAYWPNLQGFSVFNMVRAFLILFMAGVLQYTILHLYISLGQEHYYREEKELLEINEQLLHRQMELMRESQQEMARHHHDMRHHMLLIREYAQNKEFNGLLDYLDQYEEEIKNSRQREICGNQAVNSILSAYTAKAANQNISVKTNVSLPLELPIRDIDWVAILANIFENAIHGCLSSDKANQAIQIQIAKKGHKISIQCVNTCSDQIIFNKGLPKSNTGGGIGVSSILKTAARYQGETDFSVRNGMFLTRVLLNLPYNESNPSFPDELKQV